MPHLERLEYGKFCVRPDGEIEERFEHAPLFKTPGFPPEIGPRRDWKPAYHGPETGTEAPRPMPHEPGYVLRPFRIGDGIVPVWVHVRERREHPAEIRTHTVARYLTAEQPALALRANGQESMGSLLVSPLQFFRSDQAVALRGLTRNEADRLGPLPIVSGGPSRPTPLGMASEGAVYVLSATPVVIRMDPRAPVPAEAFFAEVEAIWHGLPEYLRPFFSVGWNVVGPQVEALCVSCTHDIPAAAAVYDAATRRWTPPREVRSSNASEPLKFREAWLEPGRAMCGSHYSTLVPEGLPTPVARSGPVDLADPQTRKRIRRPGYVIAQTERLDALLAWLDSGVGDPPPLPGDPAKQTEAARQAQAMLEGDDPGRHPRAFLLLWSLAGPGALGDRFASIVNAVGVRADVSSLIIDLRAVEASSGDARATQHAMEILGGMRPEMLQRVISHSTRAIFYPLWDATLGLDGDQATDSVVVGIDVLLGAGTTLFDAWLARNAGALVAWLLRLESASVHGPLVERVRLASGSEVRAASIGAIIDDALPSATDVGCVLAVERAALLRLQEDRLYARDASDRGIHLAWIRHLSVVPGGGRRPLTMVMTGGDPAVDERVADAMATSIAHGIVPESAQVAVATFVLRHWSSFAPSWRKDRHQAGWRALLERWPAGQRAVLTGTPGKDGEVSPDNWPENMPASLVGPTLRAAAPVLDREDLRPAVERLWALVVAADDGRTTTQVDEAKLCAHLAAGTLPAEAPSEAVELAATHLVRAAGKAPDSLWRNAEKPWQIGLALRASRADQVALTDRHIGALFGWNRLETLADRRRFRSDLPRSHQDVPGVRALCADYLSLDATFWQPSYARSAIAFAFTRTRRGDRGAPTRNDLRRFGFDSERAMVRAVTRYAASDCPSVDRGALFERWVVPAFGQGRETRRIATLLLENWPRLRANHRVGGRPLLRRALPVLTVLTGLGGTAALVRALTPVSASSGIGLGFWLGTAGLLCALGLAALWAEVIDRGLCDPLELDGRIPEGSSAQVSRAGGRIVVALPRELRELVEVLSGRRQAT